MISFISDTDQMQKVSRPGLATECVTTFHGFAITAFAFEEFLTHNSLHYPLYTLMETLKPRGTAAVAQVVSAAKSLLLQAEIPFCLTGSILYAYKQLGVDETVAGRGGVLA